MLSVRLARMKRLVDALERVCSDSDEQREMFQTLKQEMAAARAALKVVPPPS
jgi:hypothetical protein